MPCLYSRKLIPSLKPQRVSERDRGLIQIFTTQLLTADDLKEDQVLIRKINRIKAALNAQNEESSDEDDTGRRRRPSGQQPENISSSPATTRTPGLKNERQSQIPGLRSRQVSMVPNTQLEGAADEEQGRSGSSSADDREDEDEMEE